MKKVILALVFISLLFGCVSVKGISKHKEEMSGKIQVEENLVFMELKLPQSFGIFKKGSFVFEIYLLEDKE